LTGFIIRENWNKTPGKIKRWQVGFVRATQPSRETLASRGYIVVGFNLSYRSAVVTVFEELGVSSRNSAPEKAHRAK
jgi:hypothetical protein